MFNELSRITADVKKFFGDLKGAEMKITQEGLEIRKKLTDVIPQIESELRALQKLVGCIVEDDDGKSINLDTFE